MARNMGNEVSGKALQWKSPGTIVIAIILTASTLGCQTLRSWQDDCPGVYSGVRYYNSQIRTIPWDGKVFFAVDLPFSALFDTLLLPGSAFVERTKPPEGWVPGCQWAAHAR